jgi:hypothetical protein
MLARERRGMIGQHLSLNTLKAYLTRLVTAYKREHDFQILESVVIEVREVSPIHHDLLYL